MKINNKLVIITSLILSLFLVACDGGGATSDAEAVAADKASLAIEYITGDSSSSVTGNVNLPSAGSSGTTITWESDKTSLIAHDGTVTRPVAGDGNETVIMTATIKKGTEEDTETFELTVLQNAPDVPGAPTVTGGNESVEVEWTAVSGATAYEVWYHTSDDSSAASQSGADISAVNHSITGLSVGTTYYVWIKASNSSGVSSFSSSTNAITLKTAGSTETFTANSISFIMAYVPGGQTFPTGEDDSGSATVSSSYWIGETEVAFDLWAEVYVWATGDSDMNGAIDGEETAGSYIISRPGWRGGTQNESTQVADKYSSGNYPVTNITWRDSMVWCNALTEWHNAENGTSYDCIYTSDSSFSNPIRTSTNSTTITWNETGDYKGTQDDPYINPNAKGFRLLTAHEWECAARYIDGTDWLYGDHASGDETGHCNPLASEPGLGGLSLSTVIGDYAVYNENSGTEIKSTAVVKSKLSNALGLYDMSGNVYEWCFDWSLYSGRELRGGYYGSDETCQVGSEGNPQNPYAPDEDMSGVELGFRIGRSD